MSDIFVSYASADRDRARVLAEALTGRGWSVWWDRTIPPGKEFDQVIEEALDSAKCVVVLWSRTSTASTWVKTEAADAMRRKILVPALIDDTKIPLEFRRLQAADLSDWDGQPGHEEFEHLCRSIEANLHGRSEPVVPPPLPKPRPPRQQRIEPAPPPPYTPPADAPAKSRAGMMLGGAAVAILVFALGGFFLSEYSTRRDLQRQLDEERTRREAAADDTAPRTAEEDRPARNDASSRRSQDASPAGSTDRDRAAPDDPPQDARAARRSIELDWNDASLRYSGTLTWGRTDASLQFTAYDGLTGTPLGQFTFPAEPPRRSPYTISGVVPVVADSTTPGPHQHSVTLHFEVENGVPELIENCQTPQNCYRAAGSDFFDSLSR